MRNFKPLVIFCGCAVRFVSDLAGNPEDRFSCDAAQIIQHLQVPGGIKQHNTSMLTDEVISIKVGDHS